MTGADILDILEKVSKSVVNIDTCSLNEYLFESQSSKKGSGFVIDERLVITNAHLVKGQENICVVDGGEIIEGKVINSSRMIDLALIQVEENNLAPLTLGDSDKVRIGQSVYLIGNSLGLKGTPTVSSGIVSSVQRSVRTEAAFLVDLIQTDAHLNPGNSGGPLIDEQGNCIGVATALIPFAQGIGFSIPVNTVKQYLDSIKTKGTFELPWLGLDGVSLTRRVSNKYNLEVERGVLVTKIIRGGPADRAGLSTRRDGLLSGIARLLSLQGGFNPFSQLPDIIVSVDEQEISDFEEFVKKIREKKIGSIIELGYVRFGERRKIDVEIEGI